MAVLEAGVMLDGIPIVKQQYYDEKTTDSMLTSGLLEAIQRFAEEIFGDETESFMMKKYSIFLQKILIDTNQNSVFYIICDSTDQHHIIKSIMKDLAKEFIIHYSDFNSSCLEKYHQFKDIITKKLGDLIYRPEDRLKKVF